MNTIRYALTPRPSRPWTSSCRRRLAGIVAGLAMAFGGAASLPAAPTEADRALFGELLAAQHSRHAALTSWEVEATLDLEVFVPDEGDPDGGVPPPSRHRITVVGAGGRFRSTYEVVAAGEDGEQVLVRWDASYDGEEFRAADSNHRIVSMHMPDVPTRPFVGSDPLVLPYLFWALGHGTTEREHSTRTLRRAETWEAGGYDLEEIEHVEDAGRSLVRATLSSPDSPFARRVVVTFDRHLGDVPVRQEVVARAADADDAADTAALDGGGTVVVTSRFEVVAPLDGGAPCLVPVEVVTTAHAPNGEVAMKTRQTIDLAALRLNVPVDEAQFRLPDDFAGYRPFDGARGVYLTVEEGDCEAPPLDEDAVAAPPAE